jgi:hypothetical protein
VAGLQNPFVILSLVWVGGTLSEGAEETGLPCACAGQGFVTTPHPQLCAGFGTPNYSGPSSCRTFLMAVADHRLHFRRDEEAPWPR